MNWVDLKTRLLNGETVEFRPSGNSMTPIINSGDLVTLRPVRHVTEPREVFEKGDIVMVKIGASIYLHKVIGVMRDRVQIANNHGRSNGWTSRYNVYGKLIAINGVPKR